MLTSENFILMACCELEKVNLTIINIQRITHAFDRTFVNLINQIFVGRIEISLLTEDYNVTQGVDRCQCVVLQKII